jgi:transcriptional regulator with XRE-family HTH domain
MSALQSWDPASYSAHLKRFNQEWSAAVRAIASACPAASEECAALLQLDPLRPESDAAIASAIAAIRRLSDPLTIRTAARNAERSSFGGRLRALRLERGLSLRGLASDCRKAAKLLKFQDHTPEHYQIVRYEAGKLGAHLRTRRILAVALGVPTIALGAWPIPAKAEILTPIMRGCEWQLHPNHEHGAWGGRALRRGPAH